MDMVWNRVKRIYDSLQDDESRFIFRKRLDFCLADDYESLYEFAVCKDDDDSHSFYTLLKNRNKYKKDQPIVIFGAGRWGGFHRYLYEHYKIGKTVAYCDNNEKIHGKEKLGLPIMSVKDACNIYRSALFVLETLTNNEVIKEQLIENGISKEQIFGYISNDSIFGCQYFDDKIIPENIPDGVFIDAGCLNLGDSLEYIKRNPDFKKVYAFEPEYKNFAKCMMFKKEESCFDDERVEVVNKGLWSCKDSLSFISNAGSSTIHESGVETIDVIDLDTFMDGKEKVSFIKMDIEGAELEALKGAKEVIVKDRPNLAICIYHKYEDILDIPDYILSLVPEYKLYIRHYSCYKQETVLYAIID